MKLSDKPKLLISFSGGKTSAYMTWILLKFYSLIYEIIVVFANTGKEREETLQFIKDCDDNFHFNTIWVEAITNPEHGKGIRAKIVTFETASRNGEPFEAMIEKHGIPNVRSPHCTRELKKYAIQSYAKSIGWKKYQTAIGIRVDEIDRVKSDKKLIYPLVSYQHGVRKNDINKFWSEQSFDLKLKGYEGNCDLCYKKSFRKLMTLVIEEPKRIEWWNQMEIKYSSFIPEGKRHNIKLIPPFHFFRSNKSVLDIVDMAKNKFEPSKDDSKYFPEYKQTNLWGVELDISNGCTESCEVF
jgi:hypothetical protein